MILGPGHDPFKSCKRNIYFDMFASVLLATVLIEVTFLPRLYAELYS